MAFKPGEGGRPKGAKNKFTRKAEEHVEAVFDALQSNDTTKLEAWAKDNLSEFYKIVLGRKLVTSAESESHVIKETLSESQARMMAEEYLARASESSTNPVCRGDATGLPAGEPPPVDSGGPGKG